MLQINELTYRIGERVLLENASLTVPDGAKIGLVGRNGSGKPVWRTLSPTRAM